jgi:hypothetical protein
MRYWAEHVENIRLNAPTTENLDDTVFERLASAFSKPAQKRRDTLASALRLLAKWRQVTIDREIVRANRGRIVSGPFAGMAFVTRGTHGSLAPKLIGTYECELHAIIERIVGTNYATIVDIGCAEGYYAVGLACRMTGVRVFAYDADERARNACRQVAAANGVAERVTIGEKFVLDDFAQFAGQRALIICDIEGGERDLLLPERAPALAGFDLLAECHDVFVANVTDEIAVRFVATHAVERINRAPAPPPLPAALAFRDELDRLLATWEWRLGATPWLWMRAHTDDNRG